MSLVNPAESLENSFGQIIHQLQDIKASFKSTFRKDPLFHSGCLCQHTQASFREAHVSALPVGLVEMRRNEELCDVFLEVEGRSIPCHRVVLAAGIPYFKAMFTSANMAEANMKNISLKDLRYDVVCKIVDYAYGSEVVPHPPVVPVSETSRKIKSCLEGGSGGGGDGGSSGIGQLSQKAEPKVKDLYEAKPSLEDIHSVLSILHVANMFGMTALEENCCTYLKKFFSLESVVDIFYFCKSHGDAFLSLEAKVTNWIARNFQCVVKQAAFMDIAVEEFLLLVSSKAMYVDDEFAVLIAILSWVRHDVDSRMPHLKRLLQQTHLHQISEADMKSAMEHPVMMAAPEGVKNFVRLRHRGLADAPPPSTSGESNPEADSSLGLAAYAPTRARAHHVLIFGRKFYLEDTVKDHNLLCIDVETGGIFALPAPPRAYYGTQLGVSCYNHEVMVHAVSRSELHALVLNRFKRTEGTWDVAPVRHVSNFGSSKSGYVVDNFCRPPVIAATDGTKPFNFLLVSTHDDVDLTQRRQRIRANRKPYNAIFFWEITDDNENGHSYGGSEADLQYCRLYGSNPAAVASANHSLGGDADLDRFLRHAGRRDDRIFGGLSEPVLVFHKDTLYILDRDVGFYSFSVTFRTRETPCLGDFRHALDDAATFKADADYFFPSRQICGVACGDALYFVSRTGCLTERSDEEGDELYFAPQVIRYDVKTRDWRRIETPPCPHPASAHLFSLKGDLHLFLVQNKPSGHGVTFGWYHLSSTQSASASSPSSDEWIPQRWALPALRNYFMHTIESNCVAVTLPSHVLKDGNFLCDKRKNGWNFAAASGSEENYGRHATTTEDDADDEDDEEDADVYRAFQQAMQNDENVDEDFDGGNLTSSSSESEEEWEDELEQDGDEGEEGDDADEDDDDDDDEEEGEQAENDTEDEIEDY